MEKNKEEEKKDREVGEVRRMKKNANEEENQAGEMSRGDTYKGREERLKRKRSKEKDEARSNEKKEERVQK